MEEIVKQDNSDIDRDDDYIEDYGLSDFISDFKKELMEDFIEDNDDFNAFCKDRYSDYLNACRYKYC